MTVVIKNLSKSFSIDKPKPFSFSPKTKVNVLKDINLKIPAGKIVGITGENGAGKTTFLKIIAGIIKPNRGEIIIDGKVIGLFGTPAALDHRLSLKDSIYYWCAFLGLEKKEVGKIYDSIVREADLGEFKNASPKQFSLGMITRVAMSIGFNVKSKVIIIDEAFSSLDQEFREKTIKKLKTLAHQGVIIFIASHDENLLAESCDQVLKIKDGKIY